MTEDLFVTGLHNILVDDVDDKEKYLSKVNMKKMRKIDDKFLIEVHTMTNFEEILDDNEYELFHIILSDVSDDKQYGIWANGILSESMSWNNFNKKGKLTNYHNK